MYNPHLHFHFTGIGGAGMSSIAEVLLAQGFLVSGSDIVASQTVERLRTLGAHVHVGHAVENLASDASLLVFTSAVPEDNPELREARRRGLPLVPRAEVLAELMRLRFGIAVGGSHGKTTTTSLVAKVLEEAGLDPTTIVGGTLRHELSGGKTGQGEYLVAEADESDRSFLLLRPTIAIVTNIDDEHLSSYESSQELDDAFLAFIDSVPFYGLTICCADDPRLTAVRKRAHRRICTYGFAPEADIRAINLRHEQGSMHYTLLLEGKVYDDVTVRMPGAHLVLNSLAAVAVGRELGIEPARIIAALAQFPGVTRRLEVIQEKNGVTVMSDYGHHPTEIAATLTAVRKGWKDSLGRLFVVFEPHRYSRTQECLSQFADVFTQADGLFLTDIYPAGEAPIPGITGQRLFEAIAHSDKTFLSSCEDAFPRLKRVCSSGDMILFLGAGPIGHAAHRFVEEEF